MRRLATLRRGRIRKPALVADVVAEATRVRAHGFGIGGLPSASQFRPIR
jgi:hypothetical protein